MSTVEEWSKQAKKDEVGVIAMDFDNVSIIILWVFTMELVMENLLRVLLNL